MHHSAAGDGLRLIMTKSWKNWMDLINYVLIRNRSGNVAIIAIIFTRGGGDFLNVSPIDFVFLAISGEGRGSKL